MTIEAVRDRRAGGPDPAGATGGPLWYYTVGDSRSCPTLSRGMVKKGVSRSGQCGADDRSPASGEDEHVVRGDWCESNKDVASFQAEPRSYPAYPSESPAGQSGLMRCGASIPKLRL